MNVNNVYLSWDIYINENLQGSIVNLCTFKHLSYSWLVL